jgi:hypothetical protein
LGQKIGQERVSYWERGVLGFPFNLACHIQSRRVFPSFIMYLLEIFKNSSLGLGMWLSGRALA